MTTTRYNGGTGFVGSHLARALDRRGDALRQRALPLYVNSGDHRAGSSSREAIASGTGV